MIRLLIISPHTYQHTKAKNMQRLGLALADSNVKVRVLHAYDDGQGDPPQGHKNIDWMQPFRKFSWGELPHLLKATYGYSSDVVHLVYDLDAPMTGGLFWILPEILKKLSKPRLIVEVVGTLKKRPPALLRYWMARAQVVLAETESLERSLHAWVSPRVSAKVSFVPPLETPHAATIAAEAKTHWLTSQFSRWIFAPETVENQDLLMSTVHSLLTELSADPDLGLALEVPSELQTPSLFEWLREIGTQKQVVLLSPLRPQEREELMRLSSFWCVRHLPLTDPRAQRVIAAAPALNKKVFISSAMFIVSPSLRTWQKWCLSETDEPRDFASIALPLEHRVLDHITNGYLRLYERLFSDIR